MLYEVITGLVDAQLGAAQPQARDELVARVRVVVEANGELLVMPRGRAATLREDRERLDAADGAVEGEAG